MSERLVPIFIGNANQADQVMELLHKRHLNPVVLDHHVFDGVACYRGGYEEHEVHVGVPIVEEDMAKKILMEHERLSNERIAPVAKDASNALIRICLAVILFIVLACYSRKAAACGLWAMMALFVGYTIWNAFFTESKE